MRGPKSQGLPSYAPAIFCCMKGKRNQRDIGFRRVSSECHPVMLNILRKLLTRESRTASAVSGRRRINLGETLPPFSLYAIGDVHGCLDLLLDAERKIANDLQLTNGRGLVIMLGDYIDRGPDSAGVISHLLAKTPENMKRVCLCGNHESAFLGFLREPLKNLWWLDLGGRETLRSYGIDPDTFPDRGTSPSHEFKHALSEAIPAEHEYFLASLPIALSVGRYLFVHAGVRPGVPFDAQSDEDLMWIREPFLTQGPRLPVTVVHGHTPIEAPRFESGRIGIDTGAFITGRLTVLKIKESGPVLLI